MTMFARAARLRKPHAVCFLVAGKHHVRRDGRKRTFGCSRRRSIFNRKAALSVRIEAEILELHGPVWVGIAQALDIDAAREAAFDRGLDELGARNASRGPSRAAVDALTDESGMA